eukprot:Colp12_sorted_trinity150504_noHs@21788
MAEVEENGSEEIDPTATEGLPQLEGLLFKWTNYIHGWQERYVILNGGFLSYYKNKDEIAYGCRGAMNLKQARVTLHEFDPLRFDVSLNESLYYLRAATEEEKSKWVELIEVTKQNLSEGNSADTQSLKRRTSTSSIASVNSLKARTMKERLQELETFKEVMVKQFKTLQRHVEIVGEGGMVDPIEFKQDTTAFKATANGMIETFEQSIEMLQRYEDEWHQKVTHEKEKVRQLQDKLDVAHAIVKRGSISKYQSPDAQEGPHMALDEAEFYDAIEYTIDELEKADQQAKPIVPMSPRNQVGEHRYAQLLEAKVQEIMATSKKRSTRAGVWC